MRVFIFVAQTERQGDSDSSWCYKTFSYRASHSEAEKPAHDGCMDAEGALSKPTAAMQSLITLHVSQNLIEGSTGCYDWEAGYLLAEFVLSHPHHFKGSLQTAQGFSILYQAVQRKTSNQASTSEA